MKNKAKYIITEDFKGMRLDKCIPALDTEITRMATQRLLREEKIIVNRKNRKAIL